ncbi:MAG: hypothetical protein ACRDD8_08365 [Bacteroidales bacterium]
MILKCLGWLMFFIFKNMRVINQKDLCMEGSLMRFCVRNQSEQRGYTGMAFLKIGEVSYYIFYLKGIETANKYSLYANGQVKSLQISFCSYLLYAQSYFVNGCMKSENYQFAHESMKYFIKLYHPNGRVYFKGYEVIVPVNSQSQILLYDHTSNPVTGRIYYLNDEGGIVNSRLYEAGIVSI